MNQTCYLSYYEIPVMNSFNNLQMSVKKSLSLIIFLQVSYYMPIIARLKYNL